MSEIEKDNHLPIEKAIENLKTRYDFVQTNEISTFLKNYPSLIRDLDKVYEIKSRYFGKAPMACVTRAKPDHWKAPPLLHISRRTCQSRKRKKCSLSLMKHGGKIYQRMQSCS